MVIFHKKWSISRLASIYNAKRYFGCTLANQKSQHAIPPVDIEKAQVPDRVTTEGKTI
jgi:hypothetical protein